MSNGYLAAAFDLINVGDLDVISQARERCERLVVGVYTDTYVEQLAGRPPIVPMIERMDLVRHVRGVDEVVVHDHQSARQQLGSDGIMFEVGDGPEQLDAQRLVPRRKTASRELLAALAPTSPASAAERGVA